MRQGFTTFQTTAPCSECSGTGKRITKRCGLCKGQGVQRVERVVEVRVPAGVEDGQQLRVEGEGEEIPDGVAGDLYIEIREKEDPLYERRGVDLFAPLRVDLMTAVEGGKMEVPGPGGDTVSVELEEGVQSGALKVLRGQGLPVLGRSGARGDLYFQVWVSTPKGLTDEQKANLKEILGGSVAGDGDQGQHRGWKEWLQALFGGQGS
jgi:molecular chaperone DnaJ